MGITDHTGPAAAPDLLRLATAGSVDDGKSTLVGRLLYDTKSVLADQMAAVERASRTGDGSPDLSLLVDGLRSEREQGITIDVAYRYFATPTRSFVLADTPGHVQYTRNTVTGASTAQLAVLLVDARHGVVEQTRRHAAVMALLRVPRIVLAVNKIDLVDYDEGDLHRHRQGVHGAEHGAGLRRRRRRARHRRHRPGVGQGRRQRRRSASERTPWYDGPTLLAHLESVPVGTPDEAAPFRFPVQTVIRPRTAEHPDYRGYAGLVAAGSVAVGDEVAVLPDGQRTRVEGIDTFDGPRDRASVGDSVVLRLADDLGLARGALLAAADDAPVPVTEFEATLAWLHEKPLVPGRRLLVKHGTHTTPAMVTAIVRPARHADPRPRPGPGHPDDQRHRPREPHGGRAPAARRVRPRGRHRLAARHRPAVRRHAGRRAGGPPAGHHPAGRHPPRPGDAMTATLADARPATGVPSVSVRGVTKAFGVGADAVVALDGVDLDVAPGEFVCLLGASGCGKSTLLDLVAGLDRPTGGDVERAAGRPAVMFQEAALLPWLTAGRNVELPMRFAGVPRGRRRTRAAELLELVRLDGLADKRPHELSGGMRQRVALARALAAVLGADEDREAGVLLMDEPFGALDAITRDVLQDELIRVWTSTGTTILFVTHDVREAVRLGQRVVLMSSRPGRVVREWTTDGADAAVLLDEITAELRAAIAVHAGA